jgi:D-glycero-D-manno-heptose 1,7-bisphosphate phosphatase
VTNQPDGARGTQRRELIDCINQLIAEAAGVDDLLVCWHDDADDCQCRKPRPGLLLEAARRWDIDLEASLMIGDRWRDIDAGRSAGCTTVLVGDTEHTGRAEPDARFGSLLEAAGWIAETRHARMEGER